MDLSENDILSRIGYFKNKKKISAYDLSLKLGHSKNYFYRIESGKTKLTMDLFLKIIEILEVDTFEFFYPETESYSKDIENLKLIKSLTKEEMDSIFVLLKMKK